MGRTYEALRRAEARLQKRHAHEQRLPKKRQIISNERIEKGLNNLGLGKDQILNQTLKEIGPSIKRMDGCIADPVSSLDIKLSDPVSDHYEDIMLALIERKKLILNRFDELVGQKKYHNIKKLLQKIADKSIKTTLEKDINALYLKDKILRKEYQKLEELRWSFEIEPETDMEHISEEQDDAGKKPKKFRRSGGSWGTRVAVFALLVLLFFIFITPFIDIQIPNYLNTVSFVLLGFFFGLAISRLTKS